MNFKSGAGMVCRAIFSAIDGVTLAKIAIALIMLPWLIIFAVVGYAALGSMVCWAHYGADHVGVDGTRWLFQHCG